jgi:hypothetical protein
MEERVDINGWKSKDEIGIFEREDSYRIVEHRKSKEDGEIYEDEHIIPKQNVKILWDIIRKNCEYRSEYKYRYLVRKLIELGLMDISEVIPSFKEVDSFMRSQDKLMLDKWIDFVANISMETFNGGKFRRQVYFPRLYFPLKILEAKGLIVYFGRGGFQRIVEDERGDML